MTTKPTTIRQQRYRAKHRRIDYVPDAEVLAIIQKHAKLMPWNLAGVIDALILAGDKAVSGNDLGGKGVS
jgi:hypothetical protein